MNDKHYLLNRFNLTQEIQMQLCQKQKYFPEFFFAFLKSILNYKHLPEKGDPRTDVFLAILAPKNMLR